MKPQPTTKQKRPLASQTEEQAVLVSTPRKGKATVQTDALDHSLAYMLRRAQLLTFQAFLSTMRGLDVRPINYAVLVLMHANPGLSQVALSSALGITKANFVMVLDGLEARGFTERRKVAGDRRAFALYLTPAGEAITRRLEHTHSHLDKRIEKRLGERKTHILLKLLREFCAADHAEG